ncbi:MAG: hypothetical protein L0323_14705 [Planctomycetes bacterium]|nr:hypothetical protein [Planctomycetota bacterium]
MKKAKISDLKDSLSRYLDYVRRGGVVRVFDRERPIADIVPVARAAPGGSHALELVLRDLERKGILRRGGGSLPRDFLTRKLPRPAASVVEALLEERRGGR